MNLSQAEIDAMLSGGSGAGESELTAEEIDTLGEVGNMCMGAMATTMYTLLERRVEITTPRVEVHTTKDVLRMYQVPFVIVEVEYTKGIRGKNLLLLKEQDAALITDILMGGTGTVEEPIELNELHMSAINEIMNQMIGASATALSQLIGDAVDISPPTSELMVLQPEDGGMLGTDDLVIVINFDMEIEGLLRSQLVQLMPYEQGRELSAKLTGANEEAAGETAAQPEPEPEQPLMTQPETPPPPARRGGNASQPPLPPQPAHTVQAIYAATPDHPQAEERQKISEMQAAYAGFRREEPPVPGELVDVRPIQFESFDSDQDTQESSRGGISKVYNIPLVVSAELGTTSKNLSEILEFELGTVIMLNKSAGDPVEIMVNGKKIASGEVVIIDDNYGVRITNLPN